MSNVDTSADAVDRLVSRLTVQPFDATAAEYADVATTLRAILAERDALRARSKERQEALLRVLFGDNDPAMKIALATARREVAAEMREKAAKWHDDRATKERTSGSISGAMAEEYAAAAIRALPLPGDDA